MGKNHNTNTTEQIQINELADDSEGVKEFLDDVKNTSGLLSHLGFKQHKSLEVYIREGGYDDFEELRSDAKKFHEKNKKNIKEQITETGLDKTTIKIFKILNIEKKNLKTRANILEYITKALKLIGLNPDFSRFYLALYVSNYRKNGDYESLSKEEIIDPRKDLKGKTISNTEAWKYTIAQMPFKGSNLSASWTDDTKGVPVYVVKSYGWYPLFVYKKGTWYEISDRYSSSTGRQINNSSPESWRSENRNLETQVYFATKGEIEKLIRYADHDEIMKEKLVKFRDKGNETSTQKLRNLSSGSEWGGNPTKIKFKIKSIDEENGKAVVTIDVLDVLKRRINAGIETPENYLKGELPNVSKKQVETSIITNLGHKFKDFIGKKMSHDELEGPKLDNVEFKFNHLRSQT